MNDSVETSSLAGEAYTVVRQRILRGELILGQVVSRRKLASELGMSFLPVSEALLRLELEGLLESRPRAGTRVRIPSPEDVKGHFVVREALEIQAATLFAETATSGERAELRRLAARVDALSMQTDRILYISLHMKLHRRIAECARCPALCDAIEKLHVLHTIWYCLIRQASPNDPSRRHQDLIETICTGDRAAIQSAVRTHLALGFERTLEVLEPYFRMRKANANTFFRSSRRLKQSATALGPNSGHSRVPRAAPSHA